MSTFNETFQREQPVGDGTARPLTPPCWLSSLWLAIRGRKEFKEGGSNKHLAFSYPAERASVPLHTPRRQRGNDDVKQTAR